MQKKYVLALDASTTSVRALLFDHDGNVAADSSAEFTQYYPEPGWVEHDPMEIWDKQIACIKDAMEKAGASSKEVAAIGVANQRETTVLWDSATSTPIHRALVWQDRRTAGICDQVKAAGHGPKVSAKTGLVVDSYFSATKISWILDNVPGARKKAEEGKLRFGTIDSWLIWKLTGGAAHVTDVSNASRTLLLDITKRAWDSELLDIFNVPASVLPEVRLSSEVYGHTVDGLFETPIPVAASAGDQQASLFGQACFEKGMVKCTYGTGASLMMNIGSKPIFSQKGLLTTVACQVDEEPQYALEGLIFVSAQVVKWLRDEVKLISAPEETEDAARRVSNTDGVYLVPAFAGLAVPYWDSYARGTLIGMSLRTNRDHILRAALESIAYQIKDCIDSMEQDAQFKISEIRVDGRASKNDFLMQFQSDLLRVSVKRPHVIETTARGAAYLAGLAVKFWASKSELQNSFAVEKSFEQQLPISEVEKLYSGWKRAVERSRDWIEH